MTTLQYAKELYKNEPSLVYKEGKIYMLVTKDNPLLCYVGMTTNSLSNRLGFHCRDFDRKRSLQSKEILKYSTFDICLLEEYPCDSKEELKARERYWIQKMAETYIVVNIEVYSNPNSEHPHDRDHLTRRLDLYKKWNKVESNMYREGKIYALSSPSTDGVYIGSTQSTLRARLMKHCIDHDHVVRNTKKAGCTASEVLKYHNFTISLLEYYPCSTRKELEAREAQWIKRSVNRVNRNIPGQTHAEYYQANRDAILEKNRKRAKGNKKYQESAKKWKKEHIARIRAWNREYRKLNPEKHKQWFDNYVAKVGGIEKYREIRRQQASTAEAREKRAQYLIKNRERIRENKRVWYNENKVRINAKKRLTYDSQKRKDRIKGIVCECGTSLACEDNMSHHRKTDRHISIVNCMRTWDCNAEEARKMIKSPLWHCDVCNSDVRLFFKNRHVTSAGHLVKVLVQTKTRILYDPEPGVQDEAEMEFPPLDNIPHQTTLACRSQNGTLIVSTPSWWSDDIPLPPHAEDIDLNNGVDFFILMLSLSRTELLDYIKVCQVPDKQFVKKNGVIQTRELAIGMTRFVYGTEYQLGSQSPSETKLLIGSKLYVWCSVCKDIYATRTDGKGGGHAKTHEDGITHQYALQKSINPDMDNYITSEWTPYEVKCECGANVFMSMMNKHLMSKQHCDKSVKSADVHVNTNRGEEIQRRLDALSGRVEVTGKQRVCYCGAIAHAASIRGKHMYSDVHERNLKENHEYREAHGLLLDVGLHVWLSTDALTRIRQRIYNLTILDKTSIPEDHEMCSSPSGSCGHVGKKSSTKDHLKKHHDGYLTELADWPMDHMNPDLIFAPPPPK